MSQRTISASEATSVWGPLSQPIHLTVPGDSEAPWKDNAYYAFWDPAQDIFGSFHVSTSPNAEGRRARLSLSHEGRTVELVEDLARGTFTSESMSFDLESGRIIVDSDQVRVDLSSRPRLAIADYSPSQVIPPMGGDPVQHFEVTVEVVGSCTIAGVDVELNATGLRDRTWGHRDESVLISEYVFFFATFADWSLTGMRFTGDGGFDRTAGYVISDDGEREIDRVSVVRDAAGLCAELRLRLVDGEELRVRSQGRRGGFWVPMNSERHGPAMSAFDEFCSFRAADGAEGFGVVEHGNVRKLF